MSSLLPGHYVVAFTGHRPDKIHGDRPFIREFIRDQLTQLGSGPGQDPLLCITGMALGVDTIAAQVCIARRTPFVAAIPFEGQDTRWREEDRERYQTLLALAERVEIVSRETYHPRLYQLRNEWMVDRCDYLVAVWDGSAGGTANCIAYAMKARESRPELDGYRFDPRTRRGWPLWPEETSP